MCRVRAPAVVVLLALLLVLAPVRAYAATDYVESFVSGWETLTVRKDDAPASRQTMQVVQDGAQEGETQSVGIDSIASVVDAANSVKWGGNDGSFTLLNAIRTVYMGTTVTKEIFVLMPIGLVFLWWGVRKSVRILVKAFRRGRLSV